MAGPGFSPAQMMNEDTSFCVAELANSFWADGLDSPREPIADHEHMPVLPVEPSWEAAHARHAVWILLYGSPGAFCMDIDGARR